MKTSALSLHATLGVVLTVAMGCGDDQSDDAPERILVGATLPKTGKFEVAAGPFDALANAWADVINADGGIMLNAYGKRVPVEFLFYDDQSDGDIAKGLYEKLVTEDDVDLLLGPHASPITIKVVEVAREHEVPMIMCEANSAFLFSQGNAWTFGVIESGEPWAHRYLDMLKALTDASTIAFAALDNPHTYEVYEGAVSYAEQLGFNAVFSQASLVDSAGMDAAIASIQALDDVPDVVFVSGFEDFGLEFAQKIVAAQLNPKALHIIHHAKKSLGEPLGANAEGITGEVYWAPSMTGFAHADRFSTIQEASSVYVQDYSWAAIRMFAFDAIEAALTLAGSTDPQTVRDALRDVEFESIGGTINFDDTTGEGTMGTYPSQYQNGDLVLVWPTELKEGDYVYPRVSGQ